MSHGCSDRGGQAQVPRPFQRSYRQHHPPPGSRRTRGLYLRQHLKLASSPKCNGQQVIDHGGTLQAGEAVTPVLGYPAQHSVPVGLETAGRRETGGEPARTHGHHCAEKPSRPSCPYQLAEGLETRAGMRKGLPPLFVCSKSPEHHSTWYMVFTKQWRPGGVIL